MPLQQMMLALPGKQFKLAYYLHKDTFLTLKKAPQRESTNMTLKSEIRCLRLFLTMSSSSEKYCKLSSKFKTSENFVILGRSMVWSK